MTETLQEFGLNADKIYPFTIFKEEWKTYCKFGFALGVMVWRTKFADSTKIQDLSDEEGILFELTEDKKDEYKEKVKALILHMCSNNFF